MRVPGRMGYMVGQSSSGSQSVNTRASQIPASVSGNAKACNQQEFFKD